LEVNQRFCDIVGYACEELLTKTFGDITFPDYPEADLMGMQRMSAGEIETYSREKRYYRKDGSVHRINDPDARYAKSRRITCFSSESIPSSGKNRFSSPTSSSLSTA
jgi:PAS domain S-box-containing protein